MTSTRPNDRSEGVSKGTKEKPAGPVRVARPTHRYHEMHDRKHHRSTMATIAGILLIITGVLGMIVSIGAGALAVLIYTADVDSVNFGNGQFCSVLGQVTNERGEPIANATVTIMDENLYTTSDGGGTFCLVSLEPGVYTIEVKKDGYTTQMFETYLVDNNNINYSEYQGLKEDWDMNHYDHVRGQNYGYSDDGSDNGRADTTYSYQHDSANANNDQYSMDEETFERDHNFFKVRMNPGVGVVSSDYNDEKEAVRSFANPFTFCFAIIAISSILTLGGGVAALTQRSYGLAIVGCVAGIFTMAFFVNVIMCVIAFILLILSYEHFHKKKT